MLVLSSSAGSSAIAAPLNVNVNDKFHSHHHQIIQLVEATLPPDYAYDHSHYYSSSAASSTPSSSSSASSSSSSSASSYCSSIDDNNNDDEDSCPLSPESYSVTKRILAWRQDFDAQLADSQSSSSSSPTSSRSTSSLKRKSNDDHIPLSSHPHSHKRPRSVQSLGVHSCTACDASFMTKQRLQQHAIDRNANEACCIAVEYALE